MTLGEEVSDKPIRLMTLGVILLGIVVSVGGSAYQLLTERQSVFEAFRAETEQRSIALRDDIGGLATTLTQINALHAASIEVTAAELDLFEESLKLAVSADERQLCAYCSATGWVPDAGRISIQG